MLSNLITDRTLDDFSRWLYLRDKGYANMTAYEREAERWLMVGKRDSDRPKIILNRRGYGGRHGYDFWVEVPESVRQDEERLQAIIDGNKLASKRYGISYF